MKKSEILSIDPKTIQEEDGFTFLDLTHTEMQKQIECFADDFTTGKHVPPILVRIDYDGHIFVIEGHCILRGALMAIERGENIDFINCVSLEKDDAQCAQSFSYGTEKHILGSAENDEGDFANDDEEIPF